MKIRIALAAVAASSALATTGCSGGGQVVYQPAAYGQVVGGVGRCYYVDYRQEVGLLQAAGLCPATWIAWPAPLWWQEEYEAYYNSPAFYNRYVPAGYRTSYIHVQTRFSRTYRVQISRAQRSAVFKGSNGRTVSGSKVGAVKFGAGRSFGGSGQRYGGGSARGGSNLTGSSGRGSNSGRSGGSSRGYSGGFGGGSARGRR